MVPTQSEPSASFACSPEGLVAAVEWMEARAQALGLAPADGVRILVLLDELYANTLMHGGPTARAAEVKLALEWSDERVCFSYSDSGLPFNPLEAQDDAAERMAEGIPGGLGLRLLRAFCAELAYAREAGRNQIAAVIVLTHRPTGSALSG
jgi:serine/threonine-protein kinase RsbW